MLLPRRLVTGPAVDPVSIEEAIAQTRAEVEDTAQVVGALLQARSFIERACRIAILSQTWDALADGWPCVWHRPSACWRYRIELPVGPVQSITSVQYVDTAGATQTLAADQYQLIAANVHGSPAAIVPAYGVAWPALREQPESVTVRFVAGFGAAPKDVPEPVRLAILMLTDHFYSHRGVVAAGLSLSELPFSVRALLADYMLSEPGAL